MLSVLIVDVVNEDDAPENNVNVNDNLKVTSSATKYIQTVLKGYQTKYSLCGFITRAIIFLIASLFPNSNFHFSGWES